MSATFSKQFLTKKLVIAHCRDDLDTTQEFIERTVANCTLFSSDYLPSQEFIERTVADVLCSPVIFIQHSFPFIADLRGRLIRSYLCGDVTSRPPTDQNTKKNPFPNCNCAVGKEFQEMTVSSRDLCQTIDLIALNARNQTRKLDQ